MTNGVETTATNVPIAGLLGSEDIIRQGGLGALQALGEGVGSGVGEIRGATEAGLTDIGGGFGQARRDIAAGQRGTETQAALAGLRGPEAQAQAFQNFQASPGQAFLQEEAERALTRTAGATGGIGGGNVLRELQRQAVGLAQQDFSNQFARGQQVLGTQQAGARDLAGLASQGGLQAAGLRERGAGQAAGLLAQGGLQGANLISGTANILGGQRFQAGQQLSAQAQQQANALANLQNQLGINVSGVTGEGGANIANLISGAGTGAANLQAQLATLLANIGTGGASQAAQLQATAGQFDAAGRQGQSAAAQNAIAQLIQLQQLNQTPQTTETMLV